MQHTNQDHLHHVSFYCKSPLPSLCFSPFLLLHTYLCRLIKIQSRIYSLKVGLPHKDVPLRNTVHMNHNPQSLNKMRGDGWVMCGKCKENLPDTYPNELWIPEPCWYMSMPRRKTWSQMNTHTCFIYLYHTIHSHSKFHTKGNTMLCRLLRLEARCGCTQHIKHFYPQTSLGTVGHVEERDSHSRKQHTQYQTAVALHWTSHNAFHGNALHAYAYALCYLIYCASGVSSHPANLCFRATTTNP